MTCPLCHDPITWQHGWPACRCDSRRTLTLTVPQAAAFIGRTRACTYHLIYDGYLRADRSRRPIRVPLGIPGRRVRLLRPAGRPATLGEPAMNIGLSDPVLAALAEARHRRDQADHDIRVLLAYARELTTPRPYRLTDLAAAASMSVSGVRTAYTPQDTQTAQRILRAARDSHSPDHGDSGPQRDLPA